MQNTHFGSKNKNASNMRKPFLQTHSFYSVEKTARKIDLERIFISIFVTFLTKNIAGPRCKKRLSDSAEKGKEHCAKIKFCNI